MTTRRSFQRLGFNRSPELEGTPSDAVTDVLDKSPDKSPDNPADTDEKGHVAVQGVHQYTAEQGARRQWAAGREDDSQSVPQPRLSWSMIAKSAPVRTRMSREDLAAGRYVPRSSSPERSEAPQLNRSEVKPRGVAPSERRSRVDRTADALAIDVISSASARLSAAPVYNGRPITKHRHSIGIALFRRLPGKPVEILCVRKRSTYAFHSFVHAQYKSTSDAHVLRLLNDMTPDEKLDLLSLNFNHIWYKIWLTGTFRATFYAICKQKFELNFTMDNGARLERLVKESTNGELVWEIPKGKRDPHEPPHECAMREFEEETDIKPSQYKFVHIDGSPTKSFTHYDDGVSYTNTYFIAVATQDITPTINFNNEHQITEVSAIEWFNMSAIVPRDPRRLVIDFAGPIIKYLKKHKLV